MRRLLATFVVSNAAATGTGSLRQAILDANATTAADTIVFDASFNSPRTITLTTGLPQMSGDLTVTGPGSSLLSVRLVAPVTPVAGVFNSTAATLTMTGISVVAGSPVNANGAGLQSSGPGNKTVTLEDMVFSGLTASGLGGAVYLNNNTSLTARNCVFDGNTGFGGGAICFFSNGSLLMENCTLTNNASTATASGGGGALYFTGVAGSFVIRNSTLDHNSSARAGGGVMLENLSGNAYVQNSTLSDNSASTSGGAIALNGGTGGLTLQNSTIAGNSASASGAGAGGGGLFRASTMPNSLGLSNSIVSGNANSGAPDIRTDSFSTLQANYCAIGSSSGFSLAGGSANNVPFGTNLQLDVLNNNGGPTRTRALIVTSPLIDAGSDLWTPALLGTDQRGPGFSRRIGGEVDIGAYERQTPIAPLLLQREFLFETAPQRVRLTFSQNVGASLDASDFSLRNLTTSTTLPASSLSISFDSATNRATLTATALPNGVLPDARYRLTIVASGITNSGGMPLAADDTFDFHSLAGDATRDGQVNFDDLLILSQNYGQTGKTFSQGNFDYSADGLVGFDDLLLLSQRYGRSVLVTPATILRNRGLQLAPAEVL